MSQATLQSVDDPPPDLDVNDVPFELVYIFPASPTTTTVVPSVAIARKCSSVATSSVAAVQVSPSELYPIFPFFEHATHLFIVPAQYTTP